MKGGGFLVFIFLLFCLLFGAGMVINAIGNIFKRWRNKDEPKQPQETPVQLPVMQSTIDPLAETLRQIREASELHKTGAISAEEFLLLKQKILGEVPRKEGF